MNCLWILSYALFRVYEETTCVCAWKSANITGSLIIGFKMQARTFFQMIKSFFFYQKKPSTLHRSIPLFLTCPFLALLSPKNCMSGTWSPERAINVDRKQEGVVYLCCRQMYDHWTNIERTFLFPVTWSCARQASAQTMCFSYEFWSFAFRFYIVKTNPLNTVKFAFY